MDERFKTYANRAASYKVRLQQHRDKQRGPLENAVNIFLSLLIFVVLLVLVIPLIALIILLTIAFLIYFKIKSFFRGLGKPNAHVGPVRTDGRDNVRVIDRD